jgi:hypothetical protein
MASENCEMVLEDLRYLEEHSDEYCILKSNMRKAVGCYGKYLRDDKGMDFSASMKDAWAYIKSFGCSE